MELRVKLPGVPRTKKNSQRAIMVKESLKIIPSQAYVDWFNEQMSRALIIRHQLRECGIPLKCKVSVSAHVYRESNTGDLLGYLEALADLIQADKWTKPKPGKPPRQIRTGLGLIDDDKQIVNWDNSWPFVDAANPRIELVITTLEEWNGTLFDEEVDFDALRGK